MEFFLEESYYILYTLLNSSVVSSRPRQVNLRMSNLYASLGIIVSPCRCR